MAIYLGSQKVSNTINIVPSDIRPKISGVNFIDYDGSLIQHYTASEFAALDSMPANPSHEGLTAQGWNWSLADAKVYVAKYGNLNIGQSYITASGKTEIDISLQEERLAIACGIGLNGTMEIDWGDGSTSDTVTGTSIGTAVYIDHTYAAAGNYTIKLGITGTASIWGSSTGSYLVTKPTSVSATNMHYYANSIQFVRIGAGVTSIDSYAFQNCYSLASVTIPDSVTSIGNSAFYYCPSLASVTIPDSVTSIGSYAFQNCPSLASVTIPEGVTSIGSYMFQNCSSLASVTIPEGVASIGNGVFSDCYSLASVTIPDSVTSIGSYMFQNCHSLASVTIPEGVASIDSYAFRDCYSLASVTIPEGVASIGNGAFSYCPSMASVTIPDSVTSIGSNAFYACYSLTYVRLLPTTVPTLVNTNAFTSIPSDCVFYVPNASLASYKAATNWSTYASKMVGE